MTKIRITKEFKFEMAHALLGYDGSCKFIHGHSYLLYVTVIGAPVKDDHSPKNGMVLDFGDLKKIVHDNIIHQIDHALVLNSAIPKNAFDANNGMFGKVVFVEYQPTSENMLIDFAERLKSALPKNVELQSLRLNETATSYAEWFASDN